MTFKITQYNSLPYAYKKHSYAIYKPKEGGYNTRALKRVFELPEAMLSIYSKVFVVRIDLHPQRFSADNEIMSEFLQSYISKLKKQYRCEVAYICAREQNRSNKQHYHLGLLFSGHVINHSNKLLLDLKLAWEKHSQGTAKLIENPFYMMHRGDKSSVDPVIYRLSYLAKKFSKSNNTGANDYLCSNLKSKEPYCNDPTSDILFVDPVITMKYHQLITSEIVEIPLRRKISRHNEPSKITRCELSRIFTTPPKFLITSKNWIINRGVEVLFSKIYSFTTLQLLARSISRSLPPVNKNYHSKNCRPMGLENSS